MKNNNEISAKHIWGTIGTFAAMYVFLNLVSSPSPKEPFTYPKTYSVTREIDVNRDGRGDIVLKDGKVMLKQPSGDYLPLETVRQRELDSAYAKINAKYTFHPEKVRNNMDNLGYKINTGRYILGRN